MKNIIKNCKKILPPIMIPAINYLLRRSIVYKTGFSSFEDAGTVCSGYDDEQIIAKVLESTKKVINGEAKAERDGLCIETNSYNWQLIAAILNTEKSDCKTIVDFGGALGTVYRQNKDFFCGIGLDLRWNVVEQEKFSKVGNEINNDKNLKFYDNLQDACQSRVDVMVFSSVLCYISDLKPIVDNVCMSGPEVIFIDRTPLTTERELYCAQSVPKHIYPAKYPLVIRNEQDFFGVFTGYKVVAKWDCEFQPVEKFRFKGAILVKIAVDE